MHVIVKTPDSDIVFLQAGNDKISIQSNGSFHTLEFANILVTILVTLLSALTLLIVSMVSLKGAPGISFKMMSITFCTVRSLAG